MSRPDINVPPFLELANTVEEAQVQRRLEGSSFEDAAGVSAAMVEKGWEVVPVLGRYFYERRPQRIVATMQGFTLRTAYGYLLETISGYGRCYRLGPTEPAFRSFEREFGALRSVLLADCFIMYLPPEEFAVVAGSPRVVESIGGASIQELRAMFADDVSKTRIPGERRILEAVDAQCRMLSVQARPRDE